MAEKLARGQGLAVTLLSGVGSIVCVAALVGRGDLPLFRAINLVPACYGGAWLSGSGARFDQGTTRGLRCLLILSACGVLAGYFVALALAGWVLAILMGQSDNGALAAGYGMVLLAIWGLFMVVAVLLLILDADPQSRWLLLPFGAVTLIASVSFVEWLWSRRRFREAGDAWHPAVRWGGWIVLAWCWAAAVGAML